MASSRGGTSRYTDALLDIKHGHDRIDVPQSGTLSVVEESVRSGKQKQVDDSAFKNAPEFIVCHEQLNEFYQEYMKK